MEAGERMTSDGNSRVEVDAAALIPGSRAMLAIIARSLAPVQDQVTVPQFRILVLLAESASAMRSGDLAGALGVHPSTLVRMADRMVARGFIRRAENPANRRETLIHLEPSGRAIVRLVTRTRERDLRRIISRMSAGERAMLVAAMNAFARSATELEGSDLSAFGM